MSDTKTRWAFVEVRYIDDGPAMAGVPQYAWHNNNRAEIVEVEATDPRDAENKAIDRILRGSDYITVTRAEFKRWATHFDRDD